ncbi:MAG: YIP1 family protein [Candidatus Baltobacteraceae bacterium]|jgi:hypothetical protein
MKTPVIFPSPTEVEGEQPLRAGFLLPRDMLFAPARAFGLVAATREWLPALLIVVCIGFASVALVAPAFSNVAVETAKADRTALLSARDLADVGRTALALLVVQTTLYPALGWLFTAATLTMIARFRGAPSTFSTFFSLAANAGVAAALGELMQGLAVRLHPPSSYHTWAQIALALPLNLAIFAPHGTDREIAFLSSFDLFTAWSLVLIAYGFAQLARVRLTTALSISFGIALALVILVGL